MAETTMPPPTLLAPIGRAWTRVSPRLAPLLAVITALIITVIFMVFTGGRGDIVRGLGIAGTCLLYTSDAADE